MAYITLADFKDGVGTLTKLPTKTIQDSNGEKVIVDNDIAIQKEIDDAFAIINNSIGVIYTLPLDVSNTPRILSVWNFDIALYRLSPSLSSSSIIKTRYMDASERLKLIEQKKEFLPELEASLTQEHIDSRSEENLHAGVPNVTRDTVIP